MIRKGKGAAAPKKERRSLEVRKHWVGKEKGRTIEKQGERPHPREIFQEQPYQVKKGEKWSGEAIPNEEKRKVI